jgi:hypothetical protein
MDDDGRCPTCDVIPAPEEILTERRRGRKPRRSDPVSVALRRPHRLLDPLQT